MRMHRWLVVETDGAKLAKSRGANRVDISRPAAEIHRALELLGQDPPAALRHAPVTGILAWGAAHWRLSPLRGLTRPLRMLQP